MKLIKIEMLQQDSSSAVDPIHEDFMLCRPTTAAPYGLYPAYPGEYLTDTRGFKGNDIFARQILGSAVDPRVPYPAANMANIFGPYHGDASVGATVMSPSARSVSDPWWSDPINTECSLTQVAIPEYTMGRSFESMPYSGAHTMDTLNEDGQQHRIPLDNTAVLAYDVGSQDWTLDSATAEFWGSIEEFDLHPAFSTIIPSAAESGMPVARVDREYTASIMTYDCAAPLLPCYRAPNLFTEMGYPLATASFVDETPILPRKEHSGHELEASAQHPMLLRSNVDTSTPADGASHADLFVQPIYDTNSRAVPSDPTTVLTDGISDWLVMPGLGKKR